MGGAKAHYDGIVAFSQTDFTEDLKKIIVPVLVMHGEDDHLNLSRMPVRYQQAAEECHDEILSGFPRHAHDQRGPDQTPICLPS